MSQNIVSSGSSIIQVGNFRIPRNKDFPRPRFERVNRIVSNCISLGCERGDGGKGMQFSSKHDRELWGRK